MAKSFNEPERPIEQEYKSLFDPMASNEMPVDDELLGAKVFDANETALEGADEIVEALAGPDMTRGLQEAYKLAYAWDRATRYASPTNVRHYTNLAEKYAQGEDAQLVISALTAALVAYMHGGGTGAN